VPSRRSEDEAQSFLNEVLELATAQCRLGWR
jgi:hypothetical protein